MLQYFKAIFYRFLRFVLRLMNNVALLVVNRFSNGSRLKSDSQKTNYEASVVKIISNDIRFNNFRRNFSYSEIVENVTYFQGLAYINRIKQLDLGNFDYKAKHQNDSIGNPILFKYPEFGKISPTTLRYISVALEIKNRFGSDLTGDFVEIGGGYGGQISILADYFRINSYGVYDLCDVQNLIKKYLDSINKIKDVEFLNLETSKPKDWDLVISNYAFSELPRKLQEIYIDKVLLKSQRGYLIMNSGRENFTNRSVGKLNLKELQDLLPSFEVLEEMPKTGPDNYVIIWGHKS